MAYRYDIFISYVRAPFMGPWIRDCFFPMLKARLGEISPVRPEIFCDEEMDDGVNLTEELKNTLKDSAVLVSVWSADYFRSRWCMAEWESFRKRDEKLGLFNQANPSSLIYPILYNGETKDFHPEARKPLLKKDFSEYNYAGPAFVQSVDYLKFDKLVQQVARDLKDKRASAPPWADDFPIAEPAPLPEAQMGRPPL